MAKGTTKAMPPTFDEHRAPRYVQVASILRRRIQDGQWGVGDKIATLEALEAEFQVARVTVRQAVELLQSEGLLRSHQGKGTFVTRVPEARPWIRLATDWEALIEPIAANRPHFLPVESVPPPRIQPADGKPADAYTYLKSVQTSEGQPYALASVHLDSRLFIRAEPEFRGRVALAVLAELSDLDIDRAHQTLQIGAADIETAGHLGIALDAPTAEARCVVTDKSGTVVYLGEIVYRGDCVKLDIELLGKNRRG